MKQKVLGIAMLSQLNVADQFSKPVNWDSFNEAPKVLVLAGKDAAEDAKQWGIFLQQRFNASYSPSDEHLRGLSPHETVKVIAVATLPDVPGIFKGLFRSGFKKEAKDMGMVLDFDGQISKLFKYTAERKDPRLVILPARELDANGRHLVFDGPSKDENLRQMVAMAVENFVRERERARATTDLKPAGR